MQHSNLTSEFLKIITVLIYDIRINLILSEHLTRLVLYRIQILVLEQFQLALIKDYLIVLELYFLLVEYFPVSHLI
jgi:hypothetical protein